MNYFIQFLTVFRIFVSPIIFLLITTFDQLGWSILLFLMASITDYWDGYLARKYSLTSEIGEILDPIADKILLVFMLLAISIYSDSIFLAFISCLILAREFWVSALRDFNARKNNYSATKVTFIAKLKTTIQFFAIFLFMLGFYLNYALIIFIANFVLFASFILSVQSGLIYTLNSLKR